MTPEQQALSYHCTKCNQRRTQGCFATACPGIPPFLIGDELAQLRADLEAAREELAHVLSDWNALVAAIGSPTHGGAIGHAKRMASDLEAARLEAVSARERALVTAKWIVEAVKTIDTIYALDADDEETVTALPRLTAAGMQLAADAALRATAPKDMG